MIDHGPSEADLERFGDDQTGYCPECGAEYRPGFPECAECRVPLVASLPEGWTPAGSVGPAPTPNAKRRAADPDCHKSFI